jgi:16S rRNA (cytosine1402-N4)-methyltransferase
MDKTNAYSFFIRVIRAIRGSIQDITGENGMKRRFQRPRSTPAGEHRPVMLDEVLHILDPQPGHVVVDCTLGWGGHAVELLKRIGPTGKLIGIDFDADNLPRARERLEAVGHPFELHHGNFAGLPALLAGECCDRLVADLGMSSMQVDDAARGFSYVREGPLDMRMDRTRGRTASQLLYTIDERDLADALRELGDEPQAEGIAAAIVAARQHGPLATTTELATVISQAVEAGSWKLHPAPGQWNTHPAARTFQALRILVNRELANLDALLRQLPKCLTPGGMAAIISFHSGEDRRVKSALRQGEQTGLYGAVARDAERPSWSERTNNPRSRSAKMRWARRGDLDLRPQ